MVKKRTWKKQHKWLGLVISIFLVLFCLSGLVLNHRSLVSHLNISRQYLPSSYHFENWNRGFLRGTLPCRLNGQDLILLYGAEGCWRTDSTASSFKDFNTGLPEGRDLRALRAVVQTRNGQLFAAGQFGLYILSDTTPYRWQEIQLPLSEDERLSDLTVAGDTLLVAGRSYLYLATPPYHHFQKIELKAPKGYDGRVSLFRTVWQLHSGELFGIVGRIILDIIAVCLIILCVSAWGYWLWPKRRALRWRRHLLWIHDRVGTKTIILTLLVAFTGWCLRPPVLIALAQGRVPAIPGTSLYSDNPWHDDLRMIRYNKREPGWLLSASGGFYKLSTLHSTPVKINNTPPVSVMGLNVWQQDGSGDWLIGSFSGMFRWKQSKGQVTDYTTGKAVSFNAGPPFGQTPVAGFTSDFHHRNYVVDYDKGTEFASMPSSFSTLPMSLWEAALEIHSGRIYIYNNLGSMLVIFLSGIIIVWVLWSGYCVRFKRPTKKRKNRSEQLEKTVGKN